MPITVTFESGEFVARQGADFVSAPYAHQAVQKLRDSLKKNGHTPPSFIRRKSMREQSLQSRFIRRRVLTGGHWS